jgi:hypothetical protein
MYIIILFLNNIPKKQESAFKYNKEEKKSIKNFSLIG